MIEQSGIKRVQVYNKFGWHIVFIQYLYMLQHKKYQAPNVIKIISINFVNN